MNHSANETKSPWVSTGSLPPHLSNILCLFLFGLFWFLRTQHYAGDGDQISRMIEHGVWMVQSELLSQASFQFFYTLLHPMGWDGLSILNLVSCLFGSLSVYVLLKYNDAYTQVPFLWPLGLFCSSGFFLFCCGHTEYYPAFLFSLFLYAYICVGYLHNRFSMLHTSLAFSFAAWMHLGILFALPSLLILPVLKRRFIDYKDTLLGLIPLVFAFLLKLNILFFGVGVYGKSQGDNFVPLFEKYLPKHFYTMFEWGHALDILWAVAMRSWIFWPFILFCIVRFGPASLKRPDRLFLFVFALCFFFFACVWHPDLRVTQDWDLFAIDAAPCLLLLLSYLPEFLKTSFQRTLLIIPMTASLLIMFSYAVDKAEFGHRGYGQVEIHSAQPIEVGNLTFNGHKKPMNINGISEGIYHTKLIDNISRRSLNFYIVVAPDHRTTVRLDFGNLPENSSKP
jgi:hypothetical protein